MITLLCQDALLYLKQQKKIHNTITGLPDISEIVNIDKNNIDEYLQFIRDAAYEILSKLKPRCYAIFTQTDRKYKGKLISKQFEILKVAESLNIPLLWHKIYLQREPGKCDLHRPTYSHILCFSKKGKTGGTYRDIFSPSIKLYKNGTPLNIAQFCVYYIYKHSNNKKIIDPFCGRGTILYFANKLNIDILGIDIDKNTIDTLKAKINNNIDIIPKNIISLYIKNNNNNININV